MTEALIIAATLSKVLQMVLDAQQQGRELTEEEIASIDKSYCNVRDGMLERTKPRNPEA
jgi:hypothetical protein